MRNAILGAVAALAIEHAASAWGWAILPWVLLSAVVWAAIVGLNSLTPRF